MPCAMKCGGEKELECSGENYKKYLMPLQSESVIDTHLLNLKQIRKYTSVKLGGT